MNTISKIPVVAALAVAMLSGCAQPNPHPMDMSVAVKSANTNADHEALAVHYEQAAKDAEAKVEEHKKLLEQYKAKSYLYGKQAGSFEEHCEALINSYSKVATANAAMAAKHRQMAAGAK
jgi:hypothetical protein